MRPQVEVFYHLACMGNWNCVFIEQLTLLKKNGFDRVKLSVLGSERQLDLVVTISKKLNIETNIIFYSSEFGYFEKPAMQAIETYAKSNDGFVLYLHSKGVSKPLDIGRTKWRQLMMRELVENSAFCLDQLHMFDLVGVNWQSCTPTPHFSGNFWYASTEYLSNLEDFQNYYDNPRFTVNDKIYNRRLGCEFWIGSNFERAKVLSLFCQNVDFCCSEYWNSCSSLIY